MVDFEGGMDDAGEAAEAGDGDAQLEPGPENCFWHVFGSHQAGRVSHYRLREIRHGYLRIFPTIMGCLPIQLHYL